MIPGITTSYLAELTEATVALAELCAVIYLDISELGRCTQINVASSI
jgi:hypothetical protein